MNGKSSALRLFKCTFEVGPNQLWLSSWGSRRAGSLRLWSNRVLTPVTPERAGCQTNDVEPLLGRRVQGSRSRQAKWRIGSSHDLSHI